MNRDVTVSHMNLGDVISTGWNLFWTHIRSIVPIFLLIYIPINIGLSFVPIDQLSENEALHGFRVYLKLVQLSELLLGCLATMALAKLIESSVTGNPVTWQQAMHHALSRWGSSIGTGLLAGLIIVGMTLLLIVPGIIWSLYYTFVILVVALRGLSGKAALDYSKGLVKGQWWRVFGYVFVIQLLAICTLIALAIPFMFTPEIQFIDIISDTLTDIASALFLCMTIVFFLDTDNLTQNHSD